MYIFPPKLLILVYILGYQENPPSLWIPHSLFSSNEFLSRKFLQVNYLPENCYWQIVPPLHSKKRSETKEEKKSLATIFFKEKFLVASFNISREENSLITKRNSQASLRNYNSCRVIHYSNQSLNPHIKHWHYKKKTIKMYLNPRMKHWHYKKKKIYVLFYFWFVVVCFGAT